MDLRPCTLYFLYSHIYQNQLHGPLYINFYCSHHNPLPSQTLCRYLHAQEGCSLGPLSFMNILAISTYNAENLIFPNRLQSLSFYRCPHENEFQIFARNRNFLHKKALWLWVQTNQYSSLSI